MLKRLACKIIKNPGKLHRFLKKRYPQLPMKLEGGKYSYFPDTIYISINSACNLKCQMCDVGQDNRKSQFYMNLRGDRKSQLDIKRLKELVDEVKDFKPLMAVISTEPLLYPNLAEFIAYCTKRGLETQVTTNGLLLEKQAKELVEAGLKMLWVSLDGPPAVHDRIRGVEGSFHKAFKGMEKIVKLREKNNSDFPTININYTITALNYHALEDFAAHFDGFPVKEIVFSHLNFVTEKMAERHNKGFGNLYKTTSSSIAKISPEDIDLKILGEQIKKAKKELGKLVQFGPDLSEEELAVFYKKPEIFVRGSKCTVPWRCAQIIANGDLIPITRCFNVKLGNIYEKKFIEAWNDEKMQEFRKNLKKYGAFPACTRCCGIL